ncbi:hypothetical protein CCACVL1_03404 [Corchorus capsularis]|uniref:Uncharacterized protein n=1 Tax=Corchorus capsularis TaxID=210143 RepID=A0A1R3JZK7_COCAP|nr:hypothetical protein CCACVL1_03404 [Corchorus capsularis]
MILRAEFNFPFCVDSTRCRVASQQQTVHMIPKFLPPRSHERSTIRTPMANRRTSDHRTFWNVLFTLSSNKVATHPQVLNIRRPREAHLDTLILAN